MKNFLGSVLSVAMIAGLSLPAAATESSIDILSKDPLAVGGCQERAAEENIPAEGVDSYVQQCLEDLVNELPEDEIQDQLVKSKRDASKSTN